MGNKKKRVIMEAGSLLAPLYRYVIDMQLVSNPIDLHGTRMLRHFQNQVQFFDWKLNQQNFKYDYSESIACRSSKLSIKFVNGWERTWYLKFADQDAIISQIKMYNHFIEGIRMAQGQDDEPEDELKTY